MLDSLGVEFWLTFNLHAVALGQTLFALLYLTFPWYRTFLGRALFYKAVVFAVVIDLALVARMNPTLIDWATVFVVLYGLLALGVWFQCFAFLRVRIEGRRSAKVTDIGCEDPADEPVEVTP